MLQILLAFLAISIVSVTGYGLMEQLSLQQIMMDQRENARRLDVAAEAVAGSLVKVAGMPGVYAPVPAVAAGGWSTLPASLGGIKATVDNVPFLYCPIAPNAATSSGNSVAAPGESYAIDVKGDAVVGSSLAFNSGLANFQPVAFIIAAGRGHSEPPKCSSIGVRNNRPFINGGLVKVVSAPGAIQGLGTVSGSSSEIFVTQNGTGKGTANDPASINDALRQWLGVRPSAMTIHISNGSTVTVDAGLWGQFAASLSGSASRLTFDGNGVTVVAPSGSVTVPANFSMSGAGTDGITLIGPTLIVEQGGQFNAQGRVNLAPLGGVGSSALYVRQGGRLNIAGGLFMKRSVFDGVNFVFYPVNGVEVAGDISISGSVSQPSAVASSGEWSIGLSNGGRLSSSLSIIGDTGARNTMAGLVVSGAWSVSSDASSQVVATDPSNGSNCWLAATGSNDATFSYSGNGLGSRSAVGPMSRVSPGLADPSDPVQVEDYQDYRREVDGRQRALQTNHSNFQCI